MTHLKKLQAGFTLLEVLIALSVTVLAGVGAVAALLQANRNAYVTRNQTSAQELCEAKIDEILSVDYTLSGVRPTVLTSGTTNETVSVYVEQDNTTVKVPGSRSTTISTAELRPDGRVAVLAATVRVTYTYRGKPYSYQVCTLRAPD